MSAASTRVWTSRACLALALLMIALLGYLGFAFASPAAGSLSLPAQTNKFAPNQPAALSDEQRLSAGSDFHQFINSKSSEDSTIIGKIKPNSSVQEMNVLQNKIHDTILRIQELERAKQNVATFGEPQADCYIELTRVSWRVSYLNVVVCQRAND